MKKPSLGIIIFGWIEILSILATVMTLLRIEYLPMVLLFFPVPVAILGVFTMRLRPLARRLNLLLSPLIVFTYSCNFMIILEYMLSLIDPAIEFSRGHFSILFLIAFIIHIFFFTRPEVREQFKG